ncbi:MAG: metalloregulator ArsR/SmtB family transcription factor [Chloroherpetonaceae bacterium]|nr:metalloregulator ArsR/SmtB family transcription factor [Chthonomonadaceae bacterium]MDW8206431.1 metalloregulator ArsR/SmtB family transcription factor [Chloroherpetonaceae bacterium]
MNTTITAKHSLIDMSTLERVAPIIRHVAHPLRLRILDYLNQAGEARTVTEIMQATRASQPVVSQQLRILRTCGVLQAQRAGTHVLYSIADPSLLLLLECIQRHHTEVRA